MKRRLPLWRPDERKFLFEASTARVQYSKTKYITFSQTLFYSTMYFAAIATILLFGAFPALQAQVVPKRETAAEKTFPVLEGINEGLAVRASETMPDWLLELGKVATHEAAWITEEAVKTAEEAAKAARPIIKNTLSVKNKLDFLRKSLEVVGNAGDLLRGEATTSNFTT